MLFSWCEISLKSEFVMFSVSDLSDIIKDYSLFSYESCDKFSIIYSYIC
jgi:hypothetical protein